jgi:hypothetical protein
MQCTDCVILNGTTIWQSAFEMYCIDLCNSDMLDCAKAVLQLCHLQFSKAIHKDHGSTQLAHSSVRVNKERAPTGCLTPSTHAHHYVHSAYCTLGRRCTMLLLLLFYSLFNSSVVCVIYLFYYYFTK